MLDNIKKFFRKFNKNNNKLINEKGTNKDAAKERLHLVLMQDRANVSADFLDLMKQEIIEVIKKYIDIDEKQIDVKLTNKQNSDGTTGAPALYANIPIKGIKNESRKLTSPKKVNNNIKQTKSVNNTNSKPQNAKKEVNINNTKKDLEQNKNQNNVNKKENTSTTNKNNTNSQNTVNKNANNKNINNTNNTVTKNTKPNNNNDVKSKNTNNINSNTKNNKQDNNKKK